MRHVKKVDFYRKYTNDDSIPTRFGACMSLITIFLIIFFAIFELSKYLHPTLNHEVELAQFPVSVRENTVPLNFDIFFHKAPCSCIPYFVLLPLLVLQMRLHDMFGTKQINPAKSNTIKMKRLNSNLEFLEDSYVSPAVASKYPNLSPLYQIFLTQILENEGCHLYGYFNVYKAPGTIHFFMYLREHELLRLGINAKEALQKVSFTHKLKSVTFGNLTDQGEMVRLFGETSVTDFDKADDIPLQKDVNFCLYYFTPIPHMFSIGKERVNKETYQYSVVYNCQNNPMPTAAYQVTFAFDVTPIGIHYDKEDWSLLQLFTAISAIIAGIYVIMGVLKRALEKFV